MGKRLIGSVGLKPGTDTGFDLDEKGQIHGFTDTQFALPVGDDNQILSSLASEDSGLKWITATSGLWTQIGNYRAGSDSASTSFSSLGVDLDNDYSSVILLMSGKSSDASTGGFYLNAVSSGSKYDYTYLMNDDTTVTGAKINENVIQALPAGLIDGADQYFNVKLEITFSGIADEFLYQWSGGQAEEGNVIGSGKATLASSGDELDTINVSFGTSWRAGTQINVYKVAI